MKKKIQTFSDNLPKLTKQQAIVVVIVSVALILLFLFIFITSRNTQLESEDFKIGNNNAYSYIISGGPRIDDKISNSTIANEQRVLEESLVVNDSISRSSIIFSDNTYINLDTDSGIELSQIQQDNNSTTKIKLDRGNIFVAVNQNEIYDSKFEINFDNLDITTDYAKFYLTNNESEFTAFIEKGKLTFKKNEETIELNAGENISFGASSSLDNINSKNGVIEESNWSKFNNCFDQNAVQLLSTTSRDSSRILVNQANRLLECNKEFAANSELENEEELIAQALKDYENLSDKQKENAPEITSVTATLSNETLTCSWSSRGDFVDNYLYSVGTDVGQVDVKQETETTQKSVSVNLLNPKYGDLYYCNVKATSKYGDSKIVSSSGAYFDNSSASIDTTSIDFPPGVISGSITYDGPDNTDDFEVSIYVQDAEGNYFSNGTFVAETTYIKCDIDDKNKSLDFTTATSIETDDPDAFIGGKVYIQIKNTKSGKILDQTIVNIP